MIVNYCNKLTGSPVIEIDSHGIEAKCSPPQTGLITIILSYELVLNTFTVTKLVLDSIALDTFPSTGIIVLQCT